MNLRNLSQGGLSGHEAPNEGASNDWLTPSWILAALGPFDLDPCASESCPDRFAPNFYTWRQHGLSQPWRGFVFCNPPYGPYVGKWLARMLEHGNGIALVFARTETKVMSPIIKESDGVFFLKGRLRFERGVKGIAAHGNAGAPSMIIAFGKAAEIRLRYADIPGVFMKPVGRR